MWILGDWRSKLEGGIVGSSMFFCTVIVQVALCTIEGLTESLTNSSTLLRLSFLRVGFATFLMIYMMAEGELYAHRPMVVPAYRLSYSRFPFYKFPWGTPSAAIGRAEHMWVKLVQYVTSGIQNYPVYSFSR